MMGTISKAIKDVISEVVIDDKQWEEIRRTEEYDKDLADEIRGIYEYNMNVDAGSAYHKVHLLLFKLEKLYDMATELEDKRIVLP